MIGQLLDHYRIVSQIGQGGMGIVYRAHDEVLHRDVALKVLAKGVVEGKSAREHLLHEARASSALNHPNICTIHQIGDFNGELYIVMELVEGKSLCALIGTNGLAVESILRYGVQIAGALAHAHGRNTVHRDLKSANIVVTTEGLVKVLDFGLARRLPKPVMDEVTQTIGPLESSSSIVGTLSYMAPEVLRGQPGDPRCDLWALGVILYEAASGHVPFRGGTGFEVSSAILHELPQPLPSPIPPGLWAIVQRCLIKEPAQRYQQAGEVQAALEAVQSSSTITPQAPGDHVVLRTTVHRGLRHLQVRNGDVMLMVGTTKGAFLLRANAARSRWENAGPYFPGQAVNAMAFDGRAGRHRMWASTFGPLWGTYLRSSDDYGKIWTNPQEGNVKFPADTGTALKNIWQIRVGRADEPDVLYCGVEPAALFESRDAGDTWSMVRGLFDHPHRPRWIPGNGGMMLHSILPDATNHDRMYVAISVGGVYRTEDGGQTWQARNHGVRVVFTPEKYPDFGQCVHSITMHPSRPKRVFLQNHWGIYRTDDGGENWQDIANGVPSDFGFAILMHPHDPDCVYVLPVESDEFRCTPGRLRVYRSRNAGASWEPLMRGLPQKGAYETVLRDAMTADTLHPAGIYFGTRRGELYASSDEGKNWKKILEGLPPILCVRSTVIGEPRAPREAKAAQKAAIPASQAKRRAAKNARRAVKARSRRAHGSKAIASDRIPKISRKDAKSQRSAKKL